MKKIIISMCAAVMALCATAQQKGDMAVGLNLGVAPCLEKSSSVTNFGLGAKFQYNLTNPIRLEAALDYGFKAKGSDALTLGVNAHYIFKVTDKINVYPLVGLGYAHVKAGFEPSEDADTSFDHIPGYAEFEDDEDYGGNGSANKFFFNVGAGAEYALNSKLSVGAEIKYQYIKNFNRLPISIGVTYKF